MVSVHIPLPLCDISLPSLLYSVLFYVFLYLVICLPVAGARCSVAGVLCPVAGAGVYPGAGAHYPVAEVIHTVGK